MKDAEIKAWYEEKVASLFHPAYGTPEIKVELERKKKSDAESKIQALKEKLAQLK